MGQQQMTEREKALLARLAALPDDHQERLLEVASLSDKDWTVIRDYPATKAFWMGAAAVVALIGGALWALFTASPERLSEAVRAVSGVHGS